MLEFYGRLEGIVVGQDPRTGFLSERSTPLLVGKELSHLDYAFFDAGKGLALLSRFER